jgi:hypothetical protein
LDYKVKFTEPFLADLEQIVRRVAEVDSRAAKRLGESIIFRGEALAFFPERNPRASAPELAPLHRREAFQGVLQASI